jgi:transcriptional regulator with XRE-family HTH domain
VRYHWWTGIFQIANVPGALKKLRTQHEYTLVDLALVLGKSDSTLSEILSLNKLPVEVSM